MRLAQLCLRKLLVLFSRDDVLTHHSGHEADRPVDRSVDGRGAESPVRQRRMRESGHTGELHSTSSLRSSQAAYRHVAVLDLPVFLRRCRTLLSTRSCGGTGVVQVRCQCRTSARHRWFLHQMLHLNSHISRI